ncbi:MAG: hypothetical protein QOE86_1019 [Solirubrobacteraceae bacterium]|jgi:hypothetical protein|nr:hypothetical protein [Solirubrobacteraceae bacterium]
MSKRAALAAGATIVAIGATGCGAASSSSSSTSTAAKPSKSVNPNAPETNAAGDIPDNQVYVRFAPPGGSFSVKVPEGWSRTTTGGATIFTDKLNAVRLETVPASGPPTVAQVRKRELPKLASTVQGFRPSKVTTVSRSAGSAVRISYLATAKPNPVTGKTGQDAVERYVFFHKGHAAVLTLSGPKGADNVDPWKIVTDSVRWSG